MSEITRKLAIFSCLLLTSFCFWKAAPGLVGRNPLRIQTEATVDPTPDGWRLVSVRLLKADGTYFEAELLRPLSWIYRHHAQPGAVIQLNMPEMYVVGAAEVLSISDCPSIDPGDGPVVISTFKNVSHNVLNLYVEGETEPIGVTAGHPIWSEDRQAFVHTDQLQPGERLRTAVGKTVRITSIEIRAGPEPVYNLEIAGEHVYSVTDSGLLVHNTTPCQKIVSKGPVGGPAVLQASKMEALRLSASNWRKTTQFADGDNLVYILGDADTGDYLKVGKTSSELNKVGNAPVFHGRFSPYAKAGRRTNRNLELDIWSFGKSDQFTAELIESQIRTTLINQGHALPWDNAIINGVKRLGRDGPGVPDASIPKVLRDEFKWDYDLETLVPK
ncbi:hypothetical protein Mal35_20140 [Gimesia maris]|uniref:polymorphic toxin-type HINT domain-containing protein n=1 Tax=Gimesia maris TaxID=122 RepID=UPI0011882A5D|nr:polymorphic toxin-type HINT domain-containing protein [Gimesia maris]QDT78565.1 hypothetical protein Mal35_20140 [Gimesia maris]